MSEKKDLSNNIFYQVDQYLLFLKYSKKDFEKEYAREKPHFLTLRYHFFSYSSFFYAIYELLRKSLDKSTEEYRKMSTLDVMIGSKLKHSGLIFSSCGKIELCVDKKEGEISVSHYEDFQGITKSQAYSKGKKVDYNFEIKEQSLKNIIDSSFKAMEEAISVLEIKYPEMRHWSKDIFDS